MRDRVEPIKSLSSASDISDMLKDGFSSTDSCLSATILALARPQVRFTGAGTTCEAGAHPRGSRCSLGGILTSVRPGGPAGLGRSGPSPGSGSADVDVTLMSSESTDRRRGCVTPPFIGCAVLVFMSTIGGALRRSATESWRLSPSTESKTVWSRPCHGPCPPPRRHYQP